MIGKIEKNPQLETPIGNTSVERFYFCHQLPFDLTEQIKFRKRIGEEWSEQLLKMSVQLFPKKEVQENEVLTDTTMQAKNIDYPADVKLQKKIIDF